MTFGVTVDVPRWQAHLDAVLAREPGLVPVIKGRGYGLGTGLLAAQAQRLGVDTVAVGTPGEAAEVLATFGGDAVVLEPWTGGGPDGQDAQVQARTVRTVGSAPGLDDAAAGKLPGPFVVELDSSMQRHGVALDVLAAHRAALAPLLGTPDAPGSMRGFAVHLPVSGGRPGELEATARALVAAGWTRTTLWVSHAGAAQLARVAQAVPGLRVRERAGTRLWLGDRDALAVAGRVIDVRTVEPSSRIGYSRWRSRTSTVLVVTGGTAHGVGLYAEPAVGPRNQAVGVARNLAAVVGVRPSPFVLDGRRLGFADTPHMQVSMLALPKGARVPAIGEAVSCQVRMTISSFDAVVGVGGESLPGQCTSSSPPAPPRGVPLGGP